MQIPQLPEWMNQGYERDLYAEMVWCEGKKSKIYTDSRGNVTGGIGWNFTANGIPDWVIQGLFNQAINEAASSLTQNTSWWRFLDPVRQRAVLNLCFNLGWPRLSKFVHFLEAMSNRQWKRAGAELVNSEWWNEVGKRGPFIRHMIETGTEPAGID